nr:site-specific integrase [Paracoccus sulfuroxidans]
MQQFRIGRLNGRYTVAWNLADGRRRRFRLEARTRKEAEAEALDVIRKETMTASEGTVADMWPLYLAEREGRSASSTMRSTGKTLLPAFGHLRPDQITVQDCRDYGQQRMDAGKSQGTVWTELGHLRIVLNWAAKKGLIEKAPLIELPPKPAPKDRYLTRAEAIRLVNAEAEPHVQLAIKLMLGTAGRQGAILDLTWDRVDFRRHTIDLRVEGGGPRKGRALVPMNPMLHEALTEAKAAALSDYVIEWHGKKVQSIRKGFSRAVANAGLKDVGMHTLRHTAAVHMVEGGTDIAEVAQFLGHSNPSITFRVYARYSPTHLRRAASILDFSVGSEKSR